MRNEKSGVITETDGPPFWSEKYQCWKVPTRCGRTWPCTHVRPYPSTVTKTIRVTGTEAEVNDTVRRWHNCKTGQVTVEVGSDE